MFGKSSKLYSILFLKCARCHKGDLLEANPYNIIKFNKVKERCSKCHLKYSIEPSFYYGSMYVSYGVGIAVAVAVFVIIKLLGLDIGVLGIFVSIVAVLLLTMPYIGAVSKSIWANIFFKYDEELAESIN